MIKGKGEIRFFNWKTGQGLIHKTEFNDCSKDCKKPEHCVIFTWRHALNGKVDVEEGTMVSYAAFPKDTEAAFARKIMPVYIGR